MYPITIQGGEMNDHCKKISIENKDEEFIKLLEEEKEFWEWLSQHMHNSDINAGGIIRQHIIGILLKEKEAEHKGAKRTLLDTVGFAWRSIVSRHFDEVWEEISSYEKMSAKEFLLHRPRY
jgi:hypothetical protein